MPVAALCLTLAAAVVHALWNLLLARAPDVEAATAVALVISVVVFAPVAALTWDAQARVVPYVVASSVFELAYFALLAAAYGRSDLSLVYPLARGLAPVVVLLVSLAALGAAASAGQIAGVLLVGAGVLLVRGLRTEAADARGVALALAIAACIATYTLIDKRGVRFATPLVYLELTSLLPAAGYASGVAVARGAGALRRALTPATAAAGCAIYGAYALVLVALRLAPAASVAAVRETSVVVATALAAVVLRERVGPRRLCGAALVAGGIALIALA